MPGPILYASKFDTRSLYHLTNFTVFIVLARLEMKKKMCLQNLMSNGQKHQQTYQYRKPSKRNTNKCFVKIDKWRKQSY